MEGLDQGEISGRGNKCFHFRFDASVERFEPADRLITRSLVVTVLTFVFFVSLFFHSNFLESVAMYLVG